MVPGNAMIVYLFLFLLLCVGVFLLFGMCLAFIIVGIMWLCGWRDENEDENEEHKYDNK